MTDLSHLYALEDRLSREKHRLAVAKTQSGKRAANEVAFREHEIRMVEKEIAGEKAFLAKRGIIVEDVAPHMTDEDLLSELLA